MRSAPRCWRTDGGPPLVKMATGEESDDEELGGAQMNAQTSGLADYLAAHAGE